MSEDKALKEKIARIRSAMEHGMHRDPRFRALVDSCVAMAVEEYGQIDPEDIEQDAWKRATFAAAMMLAQVYDSDGELAAMRAELDAHKAQALEFAVLRPPVFQASLAQP